MYLLEEPLPSAVDRAPRRQKADELSGYYYAELRRSPPKLNSLEELKTSPIHRLASRDLAGKFDSLSPGGPVGRFLISRDLSAIRGGSTVLDSIALQELEEKQLSFRWEGLSRGRKGWEELEANAERLFYERPKRVMYGRLQLEASGFAKRLSIPYEMSFRKMSWGVLLWGYAPAMASKESQNQLRWSFQDVLGAQSQRSTIASYYDSMPEPAPLHWDAFRAVIAELYERFPDQTMATSADDYAALYLGGKAPLELSCRTKSLFGNGGLGFTIFRCEKCGVPKGTGPIELFSEFYDTESTDSYEIEVIQEILSEDHLRRGCAA